MKPHENQTLSEEKRRGKKTALESLFKKMLQVMDFDPDDPQLKDTPKRMAKMYMDELFSGSYTPPPGLTMFPYHSNKDFKNITFLGPITLKSTCSHHFMPFYGNAYIGILFRKDEALGISKLARVVYWFMRRPQIQEKLTDQIAQYLWEQLDLVSLIVHIEATHTCMTLRGVEQPIGSMMATTATRGEFFLNNTAHASFMDQVTRSKL